MFERYDEKARRTIFFARHEASQRSSAYIELEDLLLGALRADKLIKTELTRQAAELLTNRLRSTKPELEQPTATTVDLPLNNALKRALASGAEEAERHGHKSITPGYLVIGVLLQEDSAAAMALERVGLGLERVRELVRQEPATGLRLSTPRRPRVVSPALSSLVDSLYASLSSPLLETSDPRKRSLGHLIDLSVANLHWIAAALAQGELHAINVPGEAWVEAQKYVER